MPDRGVQAVETLPDSNCNTVFTNPLGKVLLQDFHHNSAPTD
jgi:hypothetical protein